MNKMDEIILVAPRDKVFENEKLSFQGTLSNPEKFQQIMKNIDSSFTTMRRGDAEEESEFKQPIPYAVIQRGNEFFVYERLKGGGEQRLYNKLSLGVGGHMNPLLDGDESFNGQIIENLKRELDEELFISDKDFDLEVAGFINDDSDSVGTVHLGILIVIKLKDTAEVSVRETDQLAGHWLTYPELIKKETYERLENWSKITVDIL